MPKPGDRVTLVANLQSIYGLIPDTHSCTVEIRDSNGIVRLAETPMSNLVGSTYQYNWNTTLATAYGPYMAIFRATINGEAGAPVVETFYLQDYGATGACEFAAQFQNYLEEMWWVINGNKQQDFEYDSQGRTSKVTVSYSDTDPVTDPKAIFEHTFSYNADNTVDVHNVTRIM